MRHRAEGAGAAQAIAQDVGNVLVAAPAMVICAIPACVDQSASAWSGSASSPSR